MREATGTRAGRARLKRATDPVHQEMHRHPLMTRLLEPDVRLRDVQDVTAVSYAVAHPLENARRSSGAWADLSLENHLSELGAALGPAAPAPCARPFCIAPHALLGGLYVIHGSAFGAAVIAKHVRQRLGTEAARLFPGHDTAIWTALVAALGRMDDRQAAEAEAGALAVFQFTGKRLTDALMACRSTHRVRSRIQQRSLLLRWSVDRAQWATGSIQRRTDAAMRFRFTHWIRSRVPLRPPRLGRSVGSTSIKCLGPQRLFRGEPRLRKAVGQPIDFEYAFTSDPCSCVGQSIARGGQRGLF